MSDDFDTTKAAISGLLRDAGLIDLAERVAKREGLKLAHLIETDDEPTGAHVTLWKALAKEGLAPAAISKLLGWPAATIAAALGQAAKASPLPQQKPAAVAPIKRGRPVKATTALTKRQVCALVDAAVEPLRVQISDLAKALDQLAYSFERSTDGNTAAVAAILADAASTQGIKVATLLGADRSPRAMAARCAAARRLTDELSMSTPRIGKVLRRDHTTVLYYLNGLSRKAAA